MNSLILPLLVPFLTALVLALLNGHWRLERAVALLSSLGLTAWVFWLLWYVDAHGPQAGIIGGWMAPWGIAFVADRLAAIMLCFSMSLGTIVQAYSCWTVTEQQQRYFFFPLMHIMLLGVNWAFITGDLFNLFVAYEVMLLGSYGMMMVGASKAQVRQTLKYVAINSIGSTLFVVGCGVIYATVGTLNMADLSVRTAALPGERAGLVTAASMLLLVVFGLKAATFPLTYWLPDSYPVVPPGVIGYFAGLLTKVGVYSLLRVFVLCFRQEGSAFAYDTLLFLSGFTMLLGVMGAMCQWEIRRLLSWHIISQVGYMIMGIGLAGSPDPRVVRLAIAGTILHVGHNIVVKSCLFLIGGIAERITGSQQLKQMGGILTLAPGVAGLFLVAAMSLAGVPPFSGFLSKLVLLWAGVSGGNYVVVLAASLTSLLTLYSMTKIWSYAFWRDKSREAAMAPYRGMMLPTAVLVVLAILLGVCAQPVVGLATRAADTLTQPEEYIRVVLSARAQRTAEMARPEGARLASLPEERR
ncbi:MAG TPA: proton-conducting transporter membrane subunit [Candidatus Methylomirabilis sp.]|nr:proton-conducting transporter membrane subunit [Candidatus Methylomirabilis sp.]